MLPEIGWKGVDWISLTLDRNHLWLVTFVVNLEVLWKAWNFVTDRLSAIHQIILLILFIKYFVTSWIFCDSVNNSFKPNHIVHNGCKPFSFLLCVFCLLIHNFSILRRGILLVFSFLWAKCLCSPLLCTFWTSLQIVMILCSPHNYWIFSISTCLPLVFVIQVRLVQGGGFPISNCCRHAWLKMLGVKYK